MHLNTHHSLRPPLSFSLFLFVVYLVADSGVNKRLQFFLSVMEVERSGAVEIASRGTVVIGVKRD